MATLAGSVQVPPEDIGVEDLEGLCLSREDALDYLKGAKSGSILQLEEAQRFEQPIDLSVMRTRLNLQPMQSFRYLDAQTKDSLLALGRGVTSLGPGG